MLKLLEEDGESFSRKAEMYYQKRPELISHVDEFYRMYRSLAERYDHLMAELVNNIPSDLKSHGSQGSPEQRQGHPTSSGSVLAAGSDFFHQYGGTSSDIYQKEGDEPALSAESEYESDDFTVKNYADSGNGLRKKGTEINGDSEHLLAKIREYEDELRVAKEKTRLLEEENGHLKLELQQYQTSKFSNNLPSEVESNVGVDDKVSDSDYKIQTLMEELRISMERLHASEKEIANLRLALENRNGFDEAIHNAQKDAAMWKSKFNTEKKELLKLQERIARYKASLADRDREIRELKTTPVDIANQNFSQEKEQLEAEISGLLEERALLEQKLREWELRGRYLEEDMGRVEAGIEQLKVSIAERDYRVDELGRSLDEYKLKCDELMSERHELTAIFVASATEVGYRDDQIDEMEKQLHRLSSGQHIHEGFIREVEELRWRVKEAEKELERQRVIIMEGAEEKRAAIRQLCFSLEHYRNGYHRLLQALMEQKKPTAWTKHVTLF